MWNSSTNIDDLRTLLQRLYPNVYISNRGLVLLDAQMRNPENNRDFIGNRTDQPIHDRATILPVISSED
jgi:hypothetical protein